MSHQISRDDFAKQERRFVLASDMPKRLWCIWTNGDCFYRLENGGQETDIGGLENAIAAYNES